MISLGVVKKYYFENAKVPKLHHFRTFCCRNRMQVYLPKEPKLRYISRHVNYLEKEVVSHHHHLHPLLPSQPQGQPLDLHACSLLNVMILG